MAADAYPLVVVESDAIEFSVLHSVESDRAQISVLPVAGCEFPAVFWGKVAFDVVGLGVGPPCLRVDSEETLLTWTDERAPLARAAPSVTHVNKSERRTPVRELIGSSIMRKFSSGCLQVPINGVESLKYATDMRNSLDAIQTDEMAPWDAGGIQGDRFHDVMCRPVIVHELDRWMTRNTEFELITIMLRDTDSPRLMVTAGECHASYGGTQIRGKLRQTHDTSAITDD